MFDDDKFDEKENMENLEEQSVPMDGQIGIEELYLPEIEVDDDWRLTAFIEKPKTKPKHIPGDTTKCLVSMGNYIFKPQKLVEELSLDAQNENSSHDFGKNIIPNMLNNGSKIWF